jgi:hypothetical protein
MASPQQRKVLPHQSHIDLDLFIVLFCSTQRKTKIIILQKFYPFFMPE